MIPFKFCGALSLKLRQQFIHRVLHDRLSLLRSLGQQLRFPFALRELFSAFPFILFPAFLRLLDLDLFVRCSSQGFGERIRLVPEFSAAALGRFRLGRLSLRSPFAGGSLTGLHSLLLHYFLVLSQGLGGVHALSELPFPELLEGANLSLLGPKTF